MKPLIALLLAVFSLNSFAWSLSCSTEEMKILVMVDSTSELSEDSTYDRTAPKADARVIIFKDGERFEYKNNIFVYDEGQGNFQLDAFAYEASTIHNVASIYFEHEGGYIYGFIKKPTFEVSSGELYHTGFVDHANFDDLECESR